MSKEQEVKRNQGMGQRRRRKDVDMAQDAK